MNIKPELRAEYDEYVAKNQDPYGKCAIDAGESVMSLLDAGNTPEQAEKGLNGHGLTGFLAGCAIQGVVRFHERGEEMRVWWNKFNGVKEGEDNGGVVNPAILTIG